MWLPWTDLRLQRYLRAGPGAVAHSGPYTHVRANYQLLTENLVDPAHVSFVHKSTLGTPAMENLPIETTQIGDTLLVTRWTLDSPAAPILQRYGRCPGHIDRWQYYYLYPPSIAVVDFGASDPGIEHSEEARVSLALDSGRVRLRRIVARLVSEEQNRAESLLDLRR